MIAHVPNGTAGEFETFLIGPKGKTTKLKEKNIMKNSTGSQGRPAAQLACGAAIAAVYVVLTLAFAANAVPIQRFPLKSQERSANRTEM